MTDANLMLGRIGAGVELAGSVPLDLGLAEEALTHLGFRADLDPVATAAGMVEIVEAHMERAIRAVSVEEGADPRNAVLVAFGGAGGLHASALAKRLGMRAVAVPPYAGVFSAYGLLLSPPRIDRSQSVLLTRSSGAQLEGVVAGLITRAQEQGEGEASATLDVRYIGQSHETSIPHEPGEAWDSIAQRFHHAHHVRNGFSRPDDPIEVVTVRVAVVDAPALRWADVPAPAPSGERDRGSRLVWMGTEFRSVDVVWRPALVPGEEVVGPAVIEEAEATTYLGPDDRATVRDAGTLEITW